MKILKWKVLNQQDASPSKWFPIVRQEVALPSGKRIEYFKAQLDDVAMMIPITKNKEIIFVRQYKHGVEEISLELPAGRIEDEDTPTETAVAELLEETGIEIEEEDLIKLTEVWPDPSKSTVRVTGFLVKNVEITQEQELEVTEEIEVIKIPVSELDRYILSGEIRASDTLALLSFAKLKFPLLFKK